MKILVADDDTVARKVLQTFLRQSKHDVVVVEDGTQALAVMQSADAPLVAIVDWMMPGLTGPQLCAQLRACSFTIQPYLIVLSARKEKHDIAAALDAGADDFLVKPFNIVETQARLRVAERAIERQRHFHQRIAAADQNLQQYVALFEPEANEEPAVDLLANVPALDADKLHAGWIEALTAACGQPVTSAASTASTGSRIVLGWSGLAVARNELWIDLLVEAQPGAAESLYRQAHGVAAEPENLTAFCLGLQAAVTDVVAGQLDARRSPYFAPFELVAPLAARSPFLRSLAKRQSRTQTFEIGGVTVSVSLISLQAPVIAKSAEQLRPFDVLVTPYPPPESQEIMLMPEGLALTPRLIERIAIHAEEQPSPVAVKTFRPSALATHYQRLRPGTATASA